MIKKIVLVLMLAIVSLTLISCSSPEPPEENDEFDVDVFLEQYNEQLTERKNYFRQYLLDRHSKNYSAKFGFSISAAFYDWYKETGEQKYYDQFILQTQKCYEDVARAQDCFKICYAAYHYGLFSDLYSDELKALAKKMFTTTTVYGDTPSTTNHALMFAVGTYLANQYFPGELQCEYYGYDAAQNNDPYGENTIKEVIKAYPITGVYEANSTTYFPSHFFPIMAIADCSEDEELAQIARVTLHNAIMTFAPVWQNGHISVGNQRNYQPYTAENEGGVTNTLLWYYFGGRDEFPDYNQLDSAESSFIGWALYSDFLPHWIGAAISLDREEVYEHYETHIYTKDRYETTYSDFMYTYMHQDYAVFSMKTTVSKADIYVKRLRGFDRDMWGVNWIAENPDEKSNFSICNWDAPVTDAHTQIGNSVYSDVLHHEGTVIGVFDIPALYDSNLPDYKPPKYITINMPTNHKAIIDESYKGEMYVHYGNLLIGFKISVPFNYENEDHTYTQDVTKAWFVCEVMDVDDVEGDTLEDQLYYFQSLCQGSFRTIEEDFSGRTKVSYTAIDGTTLSLQCVGDNLPTNGIINGEVQKYNIQNWPSQSNPWIEAKVGDKVITYNYKGNSVIFDFKNWTVSEREKND